MTDTTIWLAIVGVCGGAVTILGFLEKIISIRKVLRGPSIEISNRISNLELMFKEKCDKYDRYLDSDKRRIEILEQEQTVMMQSQFAILNHLCGSEKDNTEQVKSALKALQSYLTTKGITI